MSTPQPRALRHMINLLLANLALTAILAVLLLVLRDSVIGYQMAAMNVPPAAEAATRISLNTSLWTRIGTVVVVGIAYFFLIRQLRDGRRRSWVRVLALSVISPLGIVYNALSLPNPVWFTVEQAVQLVVLLALLWTATRPAVRAHFARQPVAAQV